MTEDEMFGWHHRLSTHEFDQTPKDSEGEGSLEFCNSWGHKELDTTQLPTNNNECIINSLQPQILSTRHIYNLVLFPVWPSHFIISGAISNCPLLFPSSILDTFQPVVGAHLMVSYIFLSFHTVHGVLSGRKLEWVAISSSIGSCVVRTLHYDASILGGPAGHGSQLH